MVMYAYYIEKEYWSEYHPANHMQQIRPACHMQKHTKRKHFPLRLYRCDEAEFIDYVCERPVKPTNHIQIQLPVSVRNKVVQTDLHVTCPSDHVTHSFLSCDLLSVCYCRLASSITICESPIRPVFPMFACSDQFEQIPYPLVCDHRPDCRDYSDENFYIFPEYSKASFKCGNHDNYTGDGHYHHISSSLFSSSYTTTIIMIIVIITITTNKM